MQIAQAFTRIREGMATHARRPCWHPNRAVWVGNDGYLYLIDSEKQLGWPWAPHSIDVRADDWLTDQP